MRFWRWALHVQVLAALGLALGVGAAVHAWWTPGVWAALGVHDAAAYLAHASPGGASADANAGAGVLAWGARLAGEAVEFAGAMFLLLLRFIAVPVVLLGLTVAVASLGDLRSVGRLGLRTLGCFAATLTLAVGIALAVGSTVRPGAFVSEAARASIVAEYAAQAQQRVQTAHQLKDAGVFGYLLSIVPANPFAALASAQMLQVVATAVLIGVGLTRIAPERARPVVAAAEGLSEAVMALVRGIMALAPVAVFCLGVRFVAAAGVEALLSVVVFGACVVGALGVVLAGVYPLVMYLFSPVGNKMTPGRFFRGMAPAFTLAFSSSSSSATLPVTMQCARDRLGLPGRVVNFVCPLGTTLNMDGTALYQVISVLFLAQLYGHDLTLAQHLTVGVMSAVVAVGTPGLPGASLVMMAVVLDSVGVQTEGVAIILAVDRLLDMCRTIVNVAGDAAACVVVSGRDGGGGEGGGGEGAPAGA